MNKINEKNQAKSDHDIEDSDNEIHTPLKLCNNFEEGASKKKNFSFIDLKSQETNCFSDIKRKGSFFEQERRGLRSKTEIPSPEKGEKDKICEKTSVAYNKFEEDKEKNLQCIKKEYEKNIVTRDLDQSLMEISNIKIIYNTNSTCNIISVDESLDLSKKMTIGPISEVKFPKEDFKDCKIVEKISYLPEMKKNNKKINTPIVNNLINHLFRTIIFSPLIPELIFKSHLLNTYKGLVYAKRFLKPPSTEFLREKMVNLPEIKAPKYKSLFLDLDETLIHTCPPADNPEHLIKGNDEKGNEILIGLNMRPLCLEFLKKISQYYEVYVFTAATLNYANAVVSFLDPLGQIVNGVFSRSNCLLTKNGMFIKDLRIVKNRELKNMVLVDNLAHSFGLQIDNGIPILEFQNDRNDRELKYLYDYLLQGLYVDDMRAFNKKNLKLNYLASLRFEDLLKLT